MKNKRNPRIMIGICLLAVLALLMPLMSACQAEEEAPPVVEEEEEVSPAVPDKVYKIGISQLVSHPALDATREGIIQALADKGYVDGENADINYQNSELDMSLVASIAQGFVTDKVDVIVTIATPNSQAAISAAEGTDIPVVFSAITDPVGSGMVTSWESHPDENVTGISDMVAVADDVDLIKQIVPEVEKIGTIYSAGESNSLFLVEKLKEACLLLGIEVVERTVATSADVLAASQSLVGLVDAIWIGTDNTVVTGLEALIGICEENDIPLFPSDDPSIERGGIACYGFDYYDIGYQTGEMVAKILGGVSATDIPVEKGENVFLSVNVAAAEAMGVTIPQTLIDAAETVYEE